MPPTPTITDTAAFRTHLNYVRCLENLLSSSTLTVSQPRGTFVRQSQEVNRFINLYKLTVRSIAKDRELSIQDPAIAVILTPWFPVKCYYALYYLESVLLHLIDGGMHGFRQGGHTRVRKMMKNHIDSGVISFSCAPLNNTPTLQQISALPTAPSGITTRASYFTDTRCADSLAKKLSTYNLHNAKSVNRWNLRTPAGRAAKNQYISTEKLMLVDFFYWYRIKANYRDLDYIDFERGLSEQEVFEYMSHYYEAFKLYANLLRGEVLRLL